MKKHENNEDFYDEMAQLQEEVLELRQLANNLEGYNEYRRTESE